MHVPFRCCLICIMAATSISLAAATTHADDQATPTDQSPPIAAKVPPPTHRHRVMLLREGSYLFRAVGHIQTDHPTGRTQFVIADDDPLSPGHRLSIMPSTLLDELEHMIQSAPRYRLVLEVTGQVYLFHNENYLMLTQPPLMIDHAPIDQATRPPGSSADESSPDPGSAAAIIKDLDESIGPVPRRAEAEQPDGPEANTAATATARGALLREGARIISRRGTVRRATGGSFVFVFDADADAEGTGDRPLLLLPCLLLERIERSMHRAGVEAPVLLSGAVYSYRGQNYILPTSYRIPREHTLLSP